MSRYTTFGVDLTGAVDAAQGLSDIPARILRAQQLGLATLRRSLPTKAKIDIGEEYNLLARRVAEGLNARSTPDGISLIGKSRGINAIEFGATWSRIKGVGQVAKLSRGKFTDGKYASKLKIRSGKLRGDSGEGAKYAIKRGKPPEVEPGTFIARGKNGALLVFSRGGKGAVKNKHGNYGRLPLSGIYGPSIGQMLKHGRRPERLVEFALRTLQTEQQRLLGKP